MENEEISISVLYGIYVLREQAHAHMDILCARESFVSGYLGQENYSSLAERNKSRLTDIDDFFMDSLRCSQVGMFDYGPVPTSWSSMENLEHLSPSPQVEVLLLSFERTVIEWCTFVLSSPEMDLRQSKVFLKIARHAQMEIAFILSCAH